MASNFDGDKFVMSGIESLTEQGYHVGAKVVVTKRFSVDYEPAEKSASGHGKYRVDVSKGTEMFIKGFVSAKAADKDTKTKATKAKLVFNFEHDFGKKGGLKTVDVAIDPDHVEFPATAVAAATASKSDPVIKRFPFLKKRTRTRA